MTVGTWAGWAARDVVGEGEQRRAWEAGRVGTQLGGWAAAATGGGRTAAGAPGRRGRSGTLQGRRPWRLRRRLNVPLLTPAFSPLPPRPQPDDSVCEGWPRETSGCNLLRGRLAASRHLLRRAASSHLLRRRNVIRTAARVYALPRRSPYGCTGRSGSSWQVRSLNVGLPPPTCP